MYWSVAFERLYTFTFPFNVALLPFSTHCRFNLMWVVNAQMEWASWFGAFVSQKAFKSTFSGRLRQSFGSIQFMCFCIRGKKNWKTFIGIAREMETRARFGFEEVIAPFAMYILHMEPYLLVSTWVGWDWKWAS